MKTRTFLKKIPVNYKKYPYILSSICYGFLWPQSQVLANKKNGRYEKNLIGRTLAHSYNDITS